MVRNTAMNSMGSINKVICDLSNEVMTFDLEGQIHKLTHISEMVRDRAMNSMGNICKVTSEFSDEVMTFDWKGQNPQIDSNLGIDER